MADGVDRRRSRSVPERESGTTVPTDGSGDRRLTLPAGTAPVFAFRPHDGLTFDEWLRLGTGLAQLSHATAWYLGDWVRYGERTYGTRYKAALDETRFDYQ